MINNSMNYALNEANEELEFNPIAEGLAFMYENTVNSNIIENALNERAIDSLVESGKITPLNEQEKDGFFVKIGDILKKFWSWVCSVWDKFVGWIKGLFKRGTKGKDKKKVEKGATLYLEKKSDLEYSSKLKTKSGYSYDGIINFNGGIEKAKSIGVHGGEDNVDRVREVVAAMGVTRPNSIKPDSLRPLFEQKTKGREINNIYEYYAKDFAHNGLIDKVKPVQDAVDAAEKSKNEFSKYCDEMKAKMKDNIKNINTYTDDSETESKDYYKKTFTAISRFVSYVNNVFANAYSVQLDASKKLCTQVQNVIIYFESLGFREGGGENKPEEKQKVSEAVVNNFLENLSII